MSFFFLFRIKNWEFSQNNSQNYSKEPKTAIEKLREFRDCAKLFGNFHRTQTLRV